MKYLTIPILLAMSLLPVNTNAAVDADCGWSPPTYGTPVVMYHVALSMDGGAWFMAGSTPDTTFTVSLEPNISYRARVCGEDADGRVGPFSLPSDSYVYGQPMAPGGCWMRAKTD